MPISNLFMFFILNFPNESITVSSSWWIISSADGSESWAESCSSQKLFDVVKTNSLTLKIKFSAKILLLTLGWIPSFDKFYPGILSFVR